MRKVKHKKRGVIYFILLFIPFGIPIIIMVEGINFFLKKIKNKSKKDNLF